MGNSLISQVTCYAGSTYPEHPRAFHWQDQRFAVQEVIHRWRTPQGLGFYVRCAPGNALFHLFYITQEDQWHITPDGYAMNKENSHPKPRIQGD